MNDQNLDEALEHVAVTGQWPTKEEQAKSGHYGMTCGTGEMGIVMIGPVVGDAPALANGDAK